MQLKDVQLKNYFEFLNAEEIRLKGTRIGIETILYPYIDRQQTAEQIAQTYPALSLEQVYATILYYLHNQAEVNQYLSRWLDYCLKAEQEQDKNPPPSVVRLLKVKEEQEALKFATHER